MFKRLKENKESVRKKDSVFFGQVTIEFTFCMVVVMLMVYGVIMVFRWTGVDLADRRIAHEKRFFNEPYRYFGKSYRNF